jgi:hypothetical protein
MLERISRVIAMGAALAAVACNHENERVMTPASGSTGDMSAPNDGSPQDASNGPGPVGIDPAGTQTGNPGSGSATTGSGPGTTGTASGRNDGASGTNDHPGDR